jgi:cytochrome b involved in lipid metabolism
MAPDADKVRLQRRIVNSMEDNKAEGGEEIEFLVFKNTKDLSWNLIAIDGIVFNLDGFNHRGGEQIKLFMGMM